MDFNNLTVVISGANRGLGRELARQLLERGAGPVHAGARRPETVDLPGALPLALDITDPTSVAEAARTTGDVDLLVNNAGISTRQDLLTGDLDQLRAEMETHFWGTLAMTRSFAPGLGRRGGGAIINMGSALSFQTYLGATAYAAAKSAQWALTNSTRLELAGQRTHVLGAYLASTDTDMMAGFDVPKNDPADVVRQILDGLAAGASEVLADEATRTAKRRMNEDPLALYADQLT